jgi:hypothetical protein
MNRKWWSVIPIIAAAALLLSQPSCAHNQDLVSITLQPSGGFVFEGFGAQGQFTALGTYIHPPETKDVSNQVVWTLDIANFGTLTQTGQITYTRFDGCGSGDVTATFYSNPKNPSSGSAIIGTAPVKGTNDGTTLCKP